MCVCELVYESMRVIVFALVSSRNTLTSSRLRWTCVLSEENWRRACTRQAGRYLRTENNNNSIYFSLMCCCFPLILLCLLFLIRCMCECLLSCLQFCNDVYLMLDNAWLFNRKTSKVYKFCTKLSEVFEANIDDPMHRLGYCCGHRVSSW